MELIDSNFLFLIFIISILFQCSLSLSTTLRRRLRMLDSSDLVDLMIDKQIIISESSSEEIDTNSSETNVTITDIIPNEINSADNEGVSTIMIVIIVVSGIASLGLIIPIVLYARNTMKNHK